MPGERLSNAWSRKQRLSITAVLLLACYAMSSATTASAQQVKLTWYKFSKDFINQKFPQDSAIGTLDSTDPEPAKTAHVPPTCGAKDGEIHIGIAANALVWNNIHQLVASSRADGDEEFGIVAEPVNMTKQTLTLVKGAQDNQTTFVGYFRFWNEGHDEGPAAASNPHHVLEIHPVWAFQTQGEDSFKSPSSIRPMKGYAGYGASHFKPLLSSLRQQQWLKVYEDDDYVYVQTAKADNFYQLSVQVTGEAQLVTGGTTVAVDVFSDESHQNRIYSNLRVVANQGSQVANRIQSGGSIDFLLGIFSVNLREAMKAAQGHRGVDEAVSAPQALEFFTYGIPAQHAVKNGKCAEDVEADD